MGAPPDGTLHETHHNPNEQQSLTESVTVELGNLGLLLMQLGRAAEAESAYCRAIATFELLWSANPDHIEIGSGLAGSLSNLGSLFMQSDQAAEAELAYRRAVAAYELLRSANPYHIEIKLGYAGSLCYIDRLQEAKHLVHEVLSILPNHPYANSLQQYIDELSGDD
jgi:tetratricopeptide (TPR) repeat protein